MLPLLDVGSRGDTGKLAGIPPMGSGEQGCIVEDSVKAEGSDGQEPGKVEERCSDSGDSVKAKGSDGQRP